MRHGRKVLIVVLVFLLAGGVYALLRQRTPHQATPAPPAGPGSLSAASVGAVAVPRAALGAYGSFEVPAQPAWDLSRDPALVAAHGHGRGSVLVLRCNCGKIIRMLDHDVGSDGSISPSIWHDVPGCGWHVFGRLEGWDQGEWHAGGQ